MTERQAFYARTVPGPDGCLDFDSPPDLRGYCRYRFRGKSHLAHRVALLLEDVELPVGMQVDHLCRRPSCVNPEHLEVVTPLVNTRRARSTKMNPEKVREIRELFKDWTGPTHQFGKKYGPVYGLTPSGIASVVTRKTWRDVA